MTRSANTLSSASKPFPRSLFLAAAMSSKAFVGDAISAPPYFLRAAALPVARAVSHAGSLL